MKFIWLCLILVLAQSMMPISVSAQQNFKNAYIIRQGKDSLPGQIDFKDWVNNPQKIIFRDSQTGATTTYCPTDIRSFSVDGEYYESYNVKIYPYSRDFALLAEGYFNDSAFEKQVFLKVITKGKINLFAYKDSLELPYFFIEKESGIPIQLRVSSTYVVGESGQGVVFDDIYKRQLPVYLADCGNLKLRPDRLSYNEQSLRKIIFSYNNCGKDTVEKNVQERDKIGFELSPVVGFFSSNIKFQSDYNDVAKLSFPSYSNIVFGAGLNMVLPRRRKAYSIYTDLLYKHFYSRAGGQTSSYMTLTGVLDYSTLRSDILFRYQYPNGRIAPFVNIGISNSFVLNNKSTYSELDRIDSSTQKSPFFGDKNLFRNYEQGILLGIGMRAPHFSLEGRVEKSNGMSNISTLGSPITSFYVLAGYRF